MNNTENPAVIRFRERFSPEWWNGFGTTEDINQRGIDSIEAFLISEIELAREAVLTPLDRIQLQALRDICIEEDLLDLQAYDRISRSDKIGDAWQALKVIDRLLSTPLQTESKEQSTEENNG